MGAVPGVCTIDLLGSSCGFLTTFVGVVGVAGVVGVTAAVADVGVVDVVGAAGVVGSVSCTATAVEESIQAARRSFAAITPNNTSGTIDKLRILFLL